MAAKKSSAPTKSDILATISKDTGLSKKQVSSVFESLNGVIKKSLKSHGLFTLPGLAILVTVISINVMGDGLRDALDPKLKRS